MKRKILIWLGFFCLIGLVLLVAFRTYGYFQLRGAASRFEREIGPLDQKEYAPAHVSEIDNAATILQGGAYAVAMTTEERGFLRELIEKPHDTWDQKSTERARSIVERERNRAAYQLMVQAIPLTKSSFNLRYDQGWYMPIPNYLAFIQSKSLIGARARLCLIDHDLAGAFEAMAVQERMAAALQHEPVVISCLVGQVAQSDYDSLIQETLIHSDLRALEDIQRQMRHLRSMIVPTERIFAADGAATYGELLQEYPVGIGEQISQEPLPRWLYRVNRRLFLAHILENFARFAKSSQMPLAKQVPRSRAAKWTPEEIVFDALGQFDGYQLTARLSGKSSELNLAELAVKITLLAKKQGSYPKDLSALDRPVSPYSGEAVAYEIQPDGSAVLSYPEADRYWDKTQKTPLPPKPRFIWKLPAF